MTPTGHWTKKPANPITVAISGAVTALVISYALSYLFGRFGMGVIPASGAWYGRGVFALAGLNLYASHHAVLIGSGSIPSPVGGQDQISASISLPLTIWAIIPAISLMYVGYSVANKRVGKGRWGMVIPAMFAGLIYAVILSSISFIVRAKIGASALPAVEGVYFNPPDIRFHPSFPSALANTAFFGVVFTYLGALMCVRGHETAIAGKWWACGKALIITALIIQIFVAAALWGWFAFNARSTDPEERTQLKFAQVLPTAAGMGYALVQGSTLSGGITSFSSTSSSADINLYRGITSKDGTKTTHKHLNSYAAIIGVLSALAAMFTGWLAVRWGSRDGSLPTSLRIIVMQAIYLFVIMWMCRIGWSVNGQFSTFIEPKYNNLMLEISAATFILSLIGAHIANRRYTGSISGFPIA